MRRPIFTMQQGTAIILLALCTVPAWGQIRKISVCQPNSDSTTDTTCTDGAGTLKNVVAPDGQTPINQYAGAGITDEHSSVLPPGSVQLPDGSFNTDYLFFVASDAAGVVQAQKSADIGVLVLSAAGPQTSPKVGPAPLTASNTWDPNFQWTMNFPTVDGYGNYCDNSGNCVQGAVFLPPIFQGNCPQSQSPPFSSMNRPLPLDTTFDLSYAAAGSIVPDPTGAPGSMLMIYEGANGCAPPNTGSATISMGVATSDDYGRTWPTYRGAPYCSGGAGPFCDAFQFYPLPYNNPYQGPRQGTGAFGPGVCKGNDCSTTPPDWYGRYQILTKIGGEPSAFVDAGYPNSSTPPYIYLALKLAAGGIGVARASLGRHNDTLHFETFNGRDTMGQAIWVNVGNSPNPQAASILPNATDLPPDRTPFSACLHTGQLASQPQISYYPPTGEYVLLFVCASKGDPGGSPSTADPMYWFDYSDYGSTWFWSTTTDLESQKWSPPQEFYGTWGNWFKGVAKDGTPAGCIIYDGWYPTFMSLGHAPGVLSKNGYVFSLDGDLGGCTAFQRQYVSHAFTITAN